MRDRRRRLSPRGGLALLGAVCVGVSGCATPPLKDARSDYASGRLSGAESRLTDLPETDKDRVLFLMERGMVRHSLGKYEESTRDWLEAAERERELETHSASKAAASVVVNDRTLAFRGFPYEQTLLHTYLAKNFMAMGRWDEAAVEGRNVVLRQEGRGPFPEDAYSRYVAGFSFEMIGDAANAELQYRLAAGATPWARIDPASGRVEGPTNAPAGSLPLPRGGASGDELVCFLGVGRTSARSGFESPSAGGATNPPFVEIYADGQRLGRGYLFVSTDDLAVRSWKEVALRKTSKTATRIVLKLAIADAISQSNESLGALVRAGLLALEQPDDRHWATLPQWLGVARVPCPAKATRVEAVFCRADGTEWRRVPLKMPLVRRGRVQIAICRDLEVTAELGGVPPKNGD